MKRLFLFLCFFVLFCLTPSCKNGSPASPTTTTTTSIPRATITSVTVTSPHSAIWVGQTEQMTATVNMSDGTTKAGTGTWGSDNTSVATVSQSGLVTGIAPGDATIFFDANDTQKLDAAGDTSGTKNLNETDIVRNTKNFRTKAGMRGTKNLDMTAAVRGTKKLAVQALTITAVTVTSPNSTILVGRTEQMSATVTMSDGTTKAGTGTWGSDSPWSATVNQSGLVTGIAPGDANIFFDTTGTKNVGEMNSLRGNKRLTVRNIWNKSGQGDTVFDMPTYVSRVKITGTYTGYSSNFIVHIAGRGVVNELLGTAWNQTYFEGTYVTSGGVVETLYSSGVSWSFTEVLASTRITNTARRIPNITSQTVSSNREYEIYKREAVWRRR